MIEIQCRTNIDAAQRLEWPEYLPERPMEGDLIRSLSSTKDKHIELQVVRCLWKFVEHITGIGRGRWVIETELHLPPHRFENITAFEKWMQDNVGRG